jgi:hypothetical protein
VILLMYSAHCEIYERLTALWSSILCEKEELAMWHRRKCLMGDCPDYGLKLPSRRILSSGRALGTRSWG